MKRIIALCALFLVCTVLLCSCEIIEMIFSPPSGDKTVIAFELNEDGESYSVVGLESFQVEEHEIVIPAEYNGKPVTRIASIGQDITKVTIPATVVEFDIRPVVSSTGSLTVIEIDENNPSFKAVDGAVYSKDGKTLIFYSKGNKDEVVNIPDFVTEIGPSAFYDNNTIKSVIIPNSVTKISKYAFDQCGALVSVTIPESVKIIEDYVFYFCSSLETIALPDGIAEIGDGLFISCKSLTSVTLPKNLTAIGQSAFANCTSLESIELPISLQTIGQYAFEGCLSLKSVTIPQRVSVISGCAFRGCSALTTVALFNMLQSIEYDAFAYCTSLETINFSGNVETWNGIYGYKGNWDEGAAGFTAYCIDGEVKRPRE